MSDRTTLTYANGEQIVVPRESYRKMAGAHGRLAAAAALSDTDSGDFAYRHAVHAGHLARLYREWVDREFNKAVEEVSDG